jgi:hypothetical protein
MDLNNFFNSLTDDQKTQLANALLSSVDSTSDKDKPKAKAKPKKEEPKTKKSPQILVDDNFIVTKVESVDSQNRRKEPVRARKNEWQDTGEFRDVNSPDYDLTPSPRKREAPKKIDVDCHVCGRSFKADQRFVFGEYHRCNRCVGK